MSRPSLARPIANLPDHARVVIIGAGIVGSSFAYFLTQLGWREIVVLEQGPLVHVYGSTSHAPGLIFQHNNARGFCQLAKWTVDAYSQVGAPEKAFWRVGSLEIAHSPERWHELKRKLGNALAWGLEAYLISPAEVSQLVPIMRTDDLIGAFYVPSDVDVKGVALLAGLAAMATDAGAKFFEHTRVTGIDLIPDRAGGSRVAAVQTNRGRVACEHIVCAAGLWGPVVGALAGVNIPQLACEHLYVRTTPLPALAGAQDELTTPIIRDQDKDLYFRQHCTAYGGGSYRHDPILHFADELRADDEGGELAGAGESGSRRSQGPALAPAPAALVEGFMAELRDRYPAAADAEVADAFNGMFSFTPDGNMNLGEARDVRGFWSAEAVWVTHGGGVGRAMAEWMVSGTPPLDLSVHDINRWHAFAANKAYVRARAERQYIEVYDILHPLQSSLAARPLRTSPFYEQERTLGAEFSESAGWERPQWYASNGPELEALLAASEQPDVPPPWLRTGWAARHWSPLVAAEHHATRTRAGLFDLAAFTKIQVQGPGALAYLQRLAANDMDRPVGQITYTALLNTRGGIEADLTVTRTAPDTFWMITGGAMGMRDLTWLVKNLTGDDRVTITDQTSAYTALALWGPAARRVIQQVSTADFSNPAFPYLTCQDVFVGNAPVRAMRISYAGELGWELYTPTEYGAHLWDTLWEAGRPFGLAPVGGGAFDSLRLEKGYRLWGADIHSEYNPYEAGLGFAVRLNKGEFVGRAALEQNKAKGVTRKLTCLTVDDPHVALLGKEPLLEGDRVLGYVTSANFGYTTGQSILYGYLPLNHTTPGNAVSVYSFGERHTATVTQEPLYDPTMQRLKS